MTQHNDIDNDDCWHFLPISLLNQYVRYLYPSFAQWLRDVGISHFIDEEMKLREAKGLT